MVSLQIGCGAGFDCKLAGKQWLSQGTLDDTIRAYEIVECDPFFNFGLPEFCGIVPELSWQYETEQQGDNRYIHKGLQTPFGTLEYKFLEQKRHGITPLSFPLRHGDPLDSVFWYVEQHFKALEHIEQQLIPILEKLQPHGATSVQWNIQPFELFGLAAVVDTVLFAKLRPEQYRAVCDAIREVNIEMIRKVISAGADFVFLGAPGVEMMSPQLYRDFIIPDSQKISEAVHQVGGLVYSHICSPVEPFLSRGFYNEMGIDLFETLSPPPVGNVADIHEARTTLDPPICTRGNIGLDVLLHATSDEIQEQTLELMRKTKDTKHIVAASDYLFYDIPLENVKTVVQTVKNS